MCNGYYLITLRAGWGLGKDHITEFFSLLPLNVKKRDRKPTTTDAFIFLLTEQAGSFLNPSLLREALTLPALGRADSMGARTEWAAAGRRGWQRRGQFPLPCWWRECHHSVINTRPGYTKDTDSPRH